MPAVPSDSQSDRPPRLSVFLPVHNAAPYLGQALDSLLTQSFGDFELLIHDDGSTDASLDILRSYAARDRRIRLSSGPNRGVSAASNLLIGKARAGILARADADDISLPTRFELGFDRFDRDPDLVLLGGSWITMDAKGRPIARIRPPLDHASIDTLLLKGHAAVSQPTAMMRKSAVEAAGLYDPDFRSAEDIDLWLRLAEIGRLANLPVPVLKYRLHAASLSGSQRDLQLQNCRRACEAAWARRGIQGTFEYTHWRMDNTRASRAAYYRSYGWQAWNNGFRATWRHYAWRAVATAPASPEAWKLLVAGALKRPSQPAQPAHG